MKVQCESCGKKKKKLTALLSVIGIGLAVCKDCKRDLVWLGWRRLFPKSKDVKNG